MLTDIQKETFGKLKELSPKQKADFYYRMSNILKNYLEGLDEAVYLLDKIPNSYLEKIDLQKATAKSMLLSEAMLKQLSLPTVQANFILTDIKAVRKFDLGEDNLRLPSYDDKEPAFQPIGCSITCDLTGAELEAVTGALEHVRAIESMIVPRRQKMDAQEFYAQIQPQAFAESDNCQINWDCGEEPQGLFRLLQAAVNMKKRQEAKEMMIERPSE
jgi:hypothetical protein